MKDMGALDVPYRWHSRLMEDVYFSMVSVAAGFGLGHFGAPEGPLCLEWRGLPVSLSMSLPELVTRWFIPWTKAKIQIVSRMVARRHARFSGIAGPRWSSNLLEETGKIYEYS